MGLDKKSETVNTRTSSVAEKSRSLKAMEPPQACVPVIRREYSSDVFYNAASDLDPRAESRESLAKSLGDDELQARRMGLQSALLKSLVVKNQDGETKVSNLLLGSAAHRTSQTNVITLKDKVSAEHNETR